MQEHKQEPNLEAFPLLDNAKDNYFYSSELSQESTLAGACLSGETRAVIQNMIASLATSLLMVQPDLEFPLHAEIKRSYIKGMIDSYKYLLDMQKLLSEETN